MCKMSKLYDLSSTYNLQNVFRFQAHEAQRLQAQQKEAMRILAEQKLVAQQQKILQQQPFVQDTSSVNFCFKFYSKNFNDLRYPFYYRFQCTWIHSTVPFWLKSTKYSYN